MTRQQRYLSQALKHIDALKAEETGALSDEKRQAIQARNKTYGNLCHNLPILIRTNGLCQTVAFIEEKTTSGKNANRKDAYTKLRDHIAATINPDNPPPNPLHTVRTATLTDYQRHTRALLAAWVYYKRFAISILNVEPGTEPIAGEEVA